MFRNISALFCRRLYIKNILTIKDIIHELTLHWGGGFHKVAVGHLRAV